MPCRLAASRIAPAHGATASLENPAATAVAPSGAPAARLSVGKDAIRAPPGRSTRTASSTATRQSRIRCRTCTARTEPNVPAANGSLVASAWASGNGLSPPAFAASRRSIAPEMSVPAMAIPAARNGSANRPVPTPISRHGWRSANSAVSNPVSWAIVVSGSARVAS
jgi:hypothetical protein